MRHALAATAGLALATLALSACSQRPEGAIETVDDTAPFYGTGLVIGPRATLPGLVPRLSPAFAAYKALQGSAAQYVPALRREADCSLTQAWIDMGASAIATTYPNFENRVRAAAGLPAPAEPFADGCDDSAAGSAHRTIAGGRLANGGAYAASDAYTDGAIAIYVSDAAGRLVDEHNVVVADEAANQYIGSLFAADFNGDGNGDFAIEVSAYGEGSVGRIAIMFGDGAGHFGAPAYVPIATSPSGSGDSVTIIGMTVADFDGDHQLDIAVSYTIGNGAEDAIAWLKGHGDGTFDALVDVAADVGGDLVAADFNGDDKLDLAIGDGHLLFGDGDGGFDLAPGQRFDFGNLVAGDFDGDGHIDLAVQSQTGDGAIVHVWRGDGSGGFSRVDPGYGTGYGAGVSDLVAGDIDGDGNLDLVVGAVGDGLFGPGLNAQFQTQFLLGRGDGRFASPPAYEKAVQTVADFDGDGTPDLIAIDAEGGAPGVRVLVGDGHGEFAPGAFTALGFGNPGSHMPLVAHDFDDDGKTDLVALEHRDSSSAYVHTRLGNGNGTFHASGPDQQVAFDVQTTSAGMAGQPAVADFDGDGNADLAIVGLASGHGGLYVMRGNGDGGFGSPQTVDATLAFDGNAASRVVAADLDGDGHADLVLEDGGAPFATPAVPGGTRVYRNLGGGTFAAPVALAGPDFPDGIDVGDTDGDGTPDIVATGTPSSGMLYVYKGNGDATFAAAQTTPLPDIWYRSVAIADIDGDGKADLVLGNCCGLTFGWLARGDGNGNFARPGILPLVVSPTAILLADLDGNGRPDLLMHGGAYYEDMRIFMNTWKDAIFASGFDSR
jgi:VCBS repeat protein